MSEKGTLEQATRIFLEETRRFSPKMAGKSEKEALAVHKEYANATDERLRQIGWSWEEYREYERTPQENAMEERIIKEFWGN